MTARPEPITVTDLAHPLYGRAFVLVSLASAPGPGSCALVAYQGDIVLKIPIEATSLRPTAPSDQRQADRLIFRARRQSCPTVDPVSPQPCGLHRFRKIGHSTDLAV